MERSTAARGDVAKSSPKCLSFPARIGNYLIDDKILGKGNFAVVRLATHVPTGEKVAVKIIEKRKLDAENLQKVYREIDNMKALRHPHIIRLYSTMEFADQVFLVTEYAKNGEVFDQLVAKGRYKENLAKRVFRQVLSAVSYCHSHGIVHRDLKTENLLLDSKMSVKLADFGFSSTTFPGISLTEWCGSPPYAAPELFLGKAYDGIKCDIWSLGVVLYVLVCAALPFDGDSLDQIKNHVLSGKFRIPFFMSQDCESLLKLVLVLDPGRRCGLSTILNHKWLAGEGCSAEHDSSDEDHGFDDGELNEFVLDDMEKLGYHRNLVRHMVVTNHFHDISATYHLLNDRFTRKLKSGAQTLASPIPISADSSRRSSITTGVVEPDHIPGERGSSPKLMSVGNRGSSTLSHRRGSLPPYIQLCRPSGRSAAGSPCLAEASETEETEEQSSKPKSRFLELPPDQQRDVYERRVSEGGHCPPLAQFQPSCSTESATDSQLSGSSFHRHFESLAIDDSDDPDSDSLLHYLSSGGRSKRNTFAHIVRKRASMQPGAASSRFSPVRRRHSEPKNMVSSKQRSFLEKLYNRPASPMEEVQQLQRQLDSGHASPFCHSPVSPSASYHPWYSTAQLCPPPHLPTTNTTFPVELPRLVRFPKVVVTNEFGETRTGMEFSQRPTGLHRAPSIPRAQLRPNTFGESHRDPGPNLLPRSDIPPQNYPSWQT